MRAGVLEQGTVDLLYEIGAGERLAREGLVHHGINLQFDGQRHHVPLSELTEGRAITVYGQQEVVKDLIHTRLERGGQILFEAQEVAVHDIESGKPRVIYRHGGEEHTLSVTSSPVATVFTGFAVLRSPIVRCGYMREFTLSAGWAYLPTPPPRARS